MRVRSILITAAVGVAFVGASATAAHAVPQGPGGLGNTPTTVKPPQQPKDKLAPTPTTQPPKGPGDLAPAPQDDGPKGPGDLAPAPKGGGVEPGPDTTGNGSGSDNYVPPTDGSDGPETAVEGASVESASVDAASDAAHRASDDGSSVPTFLFIFFALVVAGLIGLLATRFRSEDEDVERV